jgi:hypothetical protein
MFSLFELRSGALCTERWRIGVCTYVFFITLLNLDYFPLYEATQQACEVRILTESVKAVRFVWLRICKIQI